MVRCPFCGREFRRAFALKIHIARLHHDTNVCMVCGKEFMSLKGLMEHLGIMARRGDREHLKYAALFGLKYSKIKRNGYIKPLTVKIWQGAR